MTNNIAWPSDRDGRYKNVPNGANLQWINMQEDGIIGFILINRAFYGMDEDCSITRFQEALGTH